VTVSPADCRLELQVGETTIPYAVRESPQASRKRIVVRPAGVEVVVPAGTPLEGPDGVLEYVDRKRRWLFDSVREVGAKHEKLLTQRYASGAKLQYKGRWLMLDVQPAEVARVEITCRSKFHVRVPVGLAGQARLEAIRSAFDSWLQERALRDARAYARRHQARLGVEPEDVRLGNQKHAWGTCGRDLVVRVHWRLVQAPAPAMEYVVGHELTHLLHRNHSPEFWDALGTTMPDWADRKAMLERWEVEHRAV
jgi:predicted metal-dependent hydrolase